VEETEAIRVSGVGVPSWLPKCCRPTVICKS
jgi:hypothetical protein